MTEVTRVKRRSSLLSCFNPIQDFEYSAKVSGSLNQVDKRWDDCRADKTRSLGEGLDSLSKGTKEIEAIDLRKGESGSLISLSLYFVYSYLKTSFRVVRGRKI